MTLNVINLKDIWSYTYTVRVKEGDETVETRRQIDKREYAVSQFWCSSILCLTLNYFIHTKKMLSKTIDTHHYTIYKLRRCFQWMNRYYQLDIYEEPCNPSCRGLAILSTHSIDQDLLFPDFLQIESEVTNDAKYSMFNLSRKSPSGSSSPKTFDSQLSSNKN